MPTNVAAEIPAPRRRWPRFRLSTLLAAVTAVGVGLGWLAREADHDRQRREALLSAYADRATISTEALARLRVGDTTGAIAYLEGQADRALHGIPNWRSYDEVSPSSQFALAQAKVYRSAYPTKDAAVNWYLRDVPPLSPDQRSASLKKLSAGRQGP